MDRTNPLWISIRKLSFLISFLVMVMVDISRCQSAKTLDLLILYSPKAKDSAMAAGQNINILIQNAVNDANTSYLNSNIDMRLRLVDSEMTQGFSDLSTAPTNRIALQDPNDGILDYVHTLRNQYYADIVVLIVDFPVTSSSGVGNAQVCGEPPSTCNSLFESAAFTAIHWGFLDQRTLAHEIGHVMGLHHERASFPPNPAPIGAAPDAYGYRRWDLGNSSFSTIMGTAIQTTLGLRRVAYFSNPNINEPISGVPMGVDHNITPSSSANGARVLKDITSIISNKWRENLVGLSFKYSGSNNLTIDDGFGDSHLRGTNTIAGGFSGLVFRYSGVSEISLDQNGYLRASGFSEKQTSLPAGSLRFVNTQSGNILSGIGTDGIVKTKGLVCPYSIP